MRLINHLSLFVALPILCNCKPVATELPSEKEKLRPTEISNHPTTPTKDAVDVRMEEMRWPLSDMTGVSSSLLERQITNGDRTEALVALGVRLDATPHEEVLAAITGEGARPGESRRKLLAARDQAYHHALRWILTGDSEDAQKSLEILERVAATASSWPLYNRKGEIKSQTDKRYLVDSEANGLWGGWHPLDMGDSLPLLRTYDILRPTLALGTRKQLEERLFTYHKHFLEKFTGLLPRYHNLAGHHLIGLIRFGQVLEKPEYIHEAIRYWDQILDYSYAADGFFREVTPGYHNQLTDRLINRIPTILKGYSDPQGYRDPVSGERFDDLDLEAEKRLTFRQMRDGFNVLALPDGTLANLDDAWPRKLKTDEGTDRPGLLGISGVAKLNTGGMAAFLKFKGIRGHDHQDALGLIWFAGGNEVFSETGYREQPAKGIRFDRNWSASTASHFTAAIDEELHFKNRLGMEVTEPIPRSAYVSRPPANPGQHEVEAVNPVAGRFLNQGRLLLWDARYPEVQAMEAEQENAYPAKATLFRRTIVMVPLGNGGGYLVEIFRMRGGKTHDYFLRGGLDKPYKLSFNQPLQPATGSLYTFIQLQNEGRVDTPLEGVAIYDHGREVTSRLAGVSGQQQSSLRLFVGEAPAIRRPGKAPFSVLRHEAPDPPLETCWVWVHEAGTRQIRSATVDHADGNTVVIINLEGRRDLVFSAYDENGPAFNYDGWRFQGHLAFGSQKGDSTTGRVFSGGALSRGGLVAEGTPWLEGNVLSTTRKASGDPEDAVIIQPVKSGPIQAPFHLAHIDFGHGIRFSIPLKSATRNADGTIRAVLTHPPGFFRENSSARMTHYPGWRVKGETRIRLE